MIHNIGLGASIQSKRVAEGIWCYFLNLMAFRTRTNQDQAVRDSIPAENRQKPSCPHTIHSHWQAGFTAGTHRYWAQPSWTALVNVSIWTWYAASWLHALLSQILPSFLLSCTQARIFYSSSFFFPSPVSWHDFSARYIYTKKEKQSTFTSACPLY